MSCDKLGTMTSSRLILCSLLWLCFHFRQTPAFVPLKTLFPLHQLASFPPQPLPVSKMDEAQDPELSMNALEIIRSRGYNAEDHKVTTEDGYHLHLHRIPAANKPVVFIQHGLLCSSEIWLVNPTNKSLPFILSDNGYDVWLGNARGNPYSNTHETKSNQTADYWDFSWEEMGKYDIPAVINYILNSTGQAQLTYVGHSMGTTMFWVAMELHPELNSKIKVMIALAPVATFVHSPFGLQFSMPIAANILHITGMQPLLSEGQLFPLAELTCFRDKAAMISCMNLATMSSEANTDENGEIHTDILMKVFAHYPVKTSMKSMTHYNQIFWSGCFCRYDYGFFGNWDRYSQFHPPPYDPSKVTAPVILFSARGDIFTAAQDVAWLANQLPNLRKSEVVSLAAFNHGDFLHSYRVVPLLYSHVLRYIKEYTSL